MQIQINTGKVAKEILAATVKHSDHVSVELNKMNDVHNDIVEKNKRGKEIFAAILSGQEPCFSDDMRLMHPTRFMMTKQMHASYNLIGATYYASVVIGALAGIPPYKIAHNFVTQHERSDSSGINNYHIHTYSLYHHYSKAPNFVFDDDLIINLEKTDISKKIPAGFIVPTVNSFYISFGKRCSLSISNVESGEHQLDGAYVNISEVDCSFSDYGKTFIDISPESKFLAFDVMFTGMPKECLLNDNSIYTTFYFDVNSDESIPEQMERNVKYCKANILRINDSAISHLFIDEMVKCFELLLTCLVYLNCAEVRKKLVDEKSAAEKRINETKNPKKKRRFQQQLQRAQSYTLISASESPIYAANDDDSGDKRTNKPHYRRGFLRAQRHGEKNSLVKIIHIAPVLVNKSFLGTDGLSAKAYKVSK